MVDSSMRRIDVTKNNNVPEITLCIWKCVNDNNNTAITEQQVLARLVLGQMLEIIHLLHHVIRCKIIGFIHKLLFGSIEDSHLCVWTTTTSISCHWQACVTCCITANVLQTKVDAPRDKLATKLSWQRLWCSTFSSYSELFVKSHQF